MGASQYWQITKRECSVDGRQEGLASHMLRVEMDCLCKPTGAELINISPLFFRWSLQERESLQLVFLMKGQRHLWC